MKNQGFRKRLTDFLAGGLFAFFAFTVVSFAVYFADAANAFDFFKKLTAASADINIGDNHNRHQTVTSSYIENEPVPNVSLSDIEQRLAELTGGFGWGPEEAPMETEEPYDSSEEPADGLEYPDSLNDNGGKIVRKTYTYVQSTTCFELPNGGMLRNSSDVSTDYLKEQTTKEPDIKVSLDGSPQVLIMHTHTTECYEPYSRSKYDSDFSSRTTDLDKSVAAVGGVIADALEAAGIGVIHDTTVHDYPRYTGAYDRSSETVERILSEYPSIKIVLDIHRDAIESDGIRYAPVCEIDGQSAAQIMIICGCTNVPQYRYNLRFASKLQSKLEKDYPGLTRPILFTDRNYNQELTKASILIEMGSSSNSLEEAIYSGRLVGMGLAELIEDMADNG